MREAFLDHLAATCNVERSAKVANVSKEAVYRLRRREPAFADAWADALALGYQMLETHVVGHVLAGHGPGPIEIGWENKPATIDLVFAMKLLTTHRNATGKPHRGGKGPQFATRDETDAMLLKRLKAIELRRAREAEWAARVEAGKAGLLTHHAETTGSVAACDAVIEQIPQAKAVRDGE